ncbi:MAG TPA: hypothetical protein VM241_08915 [Candidatus Thermoplasmatota archaeon]|nr:hypothetical protein [Candidatus Thermoplasmatota archaeon]
MASSRLTKDETAASGMMAFLVAGVIFTGSLGAILIASHSSGKGVAGSAAPAAGLSSEARSLATLLFDSPGYNGTGTDWVSGTAAAALAGTPAAEGLKRLGLQNGSADDPTMLDYRKFENLRMAPLTAANDGYVNYPEARAALGLDETGRNFHIRAYPTLPNVAKILSTGHKDPNLRVAYIGHAATVQPPSQTVQPAANANLGVSSPTCAVSPNPKAYRFATTITNGGTVATQFTTVFSITFPNGVQHGENGNSLLIAADGGQGTAWIDVPAYAGVACGAGTVIRVDVNDPMQKLLTVTHTVTAGEAATTAAAAANDLFVDTPTASFRTTGTITVNYDGVDIKNKHLVFKVFSGDGEVGSPVYQNPASGSGTFDAPSSAQQRKVTFGPLAPGPYTAVLYDGSSAATSLRVTERFLVVDPRPPAYAPPAATVPVGPVTYSADGTTGNEVAMLDSLVEKFCPTYFDSTTSAPVIYPVAWTARCAGFKAGQPQPGDVFPDNTNTLKVDLPARLLDASGEPTLETTNVLVVGSNVEHQALSAGGAKWTIRDWVLGGGTLIVFGSDGQSYTWLEPVCKAMIKSSSGAINAPDTSNPVLNTADVLDWAAYSNANQVWRFNGQNACGPYTNVVIQGSIADAQAVLTMSNPGTIGAGRVILSTWRPYDLYGGTHNPDATFLEGTKLINNLLMQGYRDLFLDYGPPLPANTNVAPAVRQLQIQHPQFADPIQLQMLVFVF